MSVFFPEDEEEAIDNNTDFEREIISNTELPVEILELILQLTPASQHPKLSRVCKNWNSLIKDPGMKREVVVDLSGFEAAWRKELKSVFAVTFYRGPETVLGAYGSAIASWITRFLGPRTRTLTFSHELCDKARILWPHLLKILSTKCPRLRNINFQSGQVHLNVLENLPESVVFVRLENVRVVKRHFVEGYTECLINSNYVKHVTLRYSQLGHNVEPYLRALSAATAEQQGILMHRRGSL